MTKDTVVVIDAGTFQYCRQIDKQTDCYENIKVTYRSTNSGLNFYDETKSNPYSGVNTNVLRISNEIQIPTFSNFPVYTEKNTSNSVNVNQTSEFFSSFIVNGITYMNVIKVHVDNYQAGIDYRAADYYWAKNIGNIKKVFYEGTAVTSWGLIYKEVYQ